MPAAVVDRQKYPGKQYGSYDHIKQLYAVRCGGPTDFAWDSHPARAEQMMTSHSLTIILPFQQGAVTCAKYCTFATPPLAV